MRGFSSTGHFYVPVSGLPSTQSGVEAIQDSVAGLMTAAKDQDYSFFIQQQIGRLEDLYDECKASEDQLFRIFGVKDINELNARFQVFLEQGLNALSAINLNPLFEKIRGLISEVSTQEILNLLNSSTIQRLIFNDPLVIDKVRDTAGARLGGLLGFALQNTGKTGYQHAYITNVQGTKQRKTASWDSDIELLTIDNYLQIVSQAIDGSNSVTFDKLQNLTPWMRKRILISVFAAARGTPKLELTKQDIQDLFRQAGIDKISAALQTDFRKDIIALLQDKIADPNLQQMFADEILQNFDRYALSPNLNSVKGFAGEVQFNLLLRAAFPNASPSGLNSIGDIIPTGNMIDMGGKQFGVDSVLKNAIGRFNFQVKNYSTIFNTSKELSEWRFDSSGSMTSILNRAGVGGQDDLNKFFASWGFNTIFGADEYRGWPGSYPGTFARFSQIASKLDQVFLSYADRLIRVDQLFQAQMDDMNLFPEGLYVNTMFFIGQKLVPSSAILRGMINHFQNINTKGVINFEIASVGKLSAQKGDTLYNVIRRYEHTPNPPTYSANISGATDNIFMKYSVIINLESIMSSLL